MRALIYGAGTVGGLIGGRLARAGHEVTFLARPRLAEVLRREGLQIVEAGEETRVSDFRIASEPHEALNDITPDLIVFTMKAYDTGTALGELRAVENLPPSAASGRPPPVLCFQNGVGNEAEIARALGPDRVIAGTVTTAARMPEPGRIVVEKRRGIGLAVGHPLSPVIAGALRQAGFLVREYPDAEALKWSKLLVNIVANATSAITGLTAQAIFAHPVLYRLEIRALREGATVMRGLGLKPVDLPGARSALLARAVFLPPFLIRPLLRRAVASGRGAKMPSFYYDLERGRSEVRWLNGAIAREGERLGIAAPVNARLTDVLTGLVEGRYEREGFRGRPEAWSHLGQT